jgi:hypothetical protein
MSKIEVDAIDKQSGSTLTLGGSGTAVTLACGATQSGFGRSGSVNWQTTPKTSTFTPVNGEGYFINSGSAITANLPAGSAGAIVAFSDYARNFATYNLTITPNGSEKIGGVATSTKLNVDGQAATFVYVDSTKGWINVQNAEDTEQGGTFITATGGTITTVNCGACKVHTFTGPGTFCVSAVSNLPANNEVSYLVVAGGGGGASRVPGNGNGGGGAGGFRETKSPVTPYTASPLDGQPSAPNRITVTATAFPIAVGSGGAGGTPVGPTGVDGVTGAVSTFSTITSAGGGGGGNGDTLQPGDPGGSGGGGGGGGNGSPARSAAGAGNTPPTTPPQGNPGGTGAHPSPSGDANAAGGGGATAAGSANPPSDGKGGAGGAGATTSITASPVGYAGGGEGTGGCNPGGNPAAPFGGGNGGYPSADATAGATNKGGGGGGGRYSGGPSGGASGGSGVVIIRYKIG